MKKAEILSKNCMKIVELVLFLKIKQNGKYTSKYKGSKLKSRSADLL